MDIISNMLTSIRNANAKNKEKVDIPFSNVKFSLAKILKEEGFISNYKLVPVDGSKKNLIRVTLKYTQDKEPVIKGLQRISRPGLRIYRSYKNIPKIRAAFGVTILSTPKGILADSTAKKEKVGGEVLCQVW